MNQKLLSVAKGETPADLVIRNGKVVNVYSGEIYDGGVAICGDTIAAEREQWNDGSNTLCIAPGRVITYDRNYVTNELLDKKGIDVISIPSAELSRGRGGPRCMSCPVNRDDL